MLGNAPRHRNRRLSREVVHEQAIKRSLLLLIKGLQAGRSGYRCRSLILINRVLGVGIGQYIGNIALL